MAADQGAGFEQYRRPTKRDAFLAAMERLCCSGDEAERAKNRSKSRIRAQVEHVFVLVKPVGGFAKLRYRGLYKNVLHAFARSVWSAST